MKIMVDTSAMVYLSETAPYIFSKVKLATIKEVLHEVKHLVKDPVALSDIDSNFSIIETVRNELPGQDKSLSEVDVLLVQTAASSNSMAISDDKKLVNFAKMNKCKAMTSPQFIEWCASRGQIDKADAIEALEKLELIYVRRKAVGVILKRINKQR